MANLTAAYDKTIHLSKGLNYKQRKFLATLYTKDMSLSNIKIIRDIGVETGVWLYDIKPLIRQDRLISYIPAIEYLGNILKNKSPKMTMMLLNARINGYNKEQIKVLYKIYKITTNISNCISTSSSIKELENILSIVRLGYKASSKISNIMYAIENNVECEKYITPEFTDDQIMCVINGLISGVDVTWYNNYKFSLDKMIAIKNVLEAGFNPTPLLNCKDNSIMILRTEHKILFDSDAQIKHSYENLANAIIEQAAKDYKKGLTYPSLDYDAESAERFLNSKNINLLTGISGKYILRKLEEEYKAGS